MLDCKGKESESAISVKGTAESHFLHCLFSSLHEAQIAYAVMRNYHPLPFSSGGSDLDIFVNPSDAKRMEVILLQAVSMAHGVAIGVARTSGFFKIYAFGRTNKHVTGWWGQRVDVNAGLVFKGIPLLDNNKWGIFIGRHNNVSVMTDDLAGVLGVLKEVLNNSRIPSRYLASAQNAATRNWHAIEEVIHPMGGQALALLQKLILWPAEEQKNRDKGCQEISRALILYAFQKNPFRVVLQRLSVQWSKIYRYLKPSGKVIAILGVDGAGKSTIINAIKPVLDDATHNATVVQHLRPSWLPPLARLKGKSAISSGPVLDPHVSKPSGALGSLFRLMYLTLDYILGYWLKIRPNIAKQPTIVIFDRYAYDMALDPRRFRINLPLSIIRWFIRLAPKPDIIFCLHGSPENIAARKQELPVEEVRRQVEALQAFAEDEPRAILISTEGSVEESRDQVFQAICACCANRAGK